MNSIKTLVRPRTRRAARSLSVKPKRIPFSGIGIVAVLSCPVIFGLDVFSDAHVSIGVVYMVMLALLSNEKNILVLLFTTLSSIMLLIDLRLFYGEPDTTLAVLDKLLAIPAMWLYVFALLRHRHKQSTTNTQKVIRMKRSHIPVCNIKIVNPISERIPTAEESKPVYKHIRTSRKKIDPYTRDLVYFLYAKTQKN